MSFGGAFLRFGGVGIRALQFCCAAIALGIFSYFLSVLADHDLPIANKWRAVEGMTGAATLYTIFGIILTLCLGGVAVFGFIAIILDICFVGCFAAVAYFTRHGAGSCSGFVRTPLGSGQSNSKTAGYGSNGFGFGNNENVTYLPNLHTACRLNTAVFAVSIISIFLFLLSAVWQVMMIRHHKKEKRFGPSPANNYTKGTGRTPFWKRGRKARNTRDAEAATGYGARPSGETGTTLGNNAYQSEPKYGEPGYGQTPTYHDHTTTARF